MSPSSTSDALHPWLVFEMAGHLYGVAAGAVRESVLLPRLWPLAEAPSYVLGGFDFHGQIVPVIDLALRAGQKTGRLLVTDAIVVCEVGSRLRGLRCSRLLELLQPEQTEPVPQYDKPGTLEETIRDAGAVVALARYEDEVVNLLDLEAFLYGFTDVMVPPDAEEPFWSEAEATMLQERTLLYRQDLGQIERGGRSLLAVRLEEESYGIDAGMVQELCRPLRIAPVPCCPPHIAGVFNLRGEVLTLIDIRPTLHLSSTSSSETPLVMVVRLDKTSVGVLIHDAWDVLRVEAGKIALPTIRSGNDEPAGPLDRLHPYLSGTLVVDGQTLNVLDLTALLGGEGFEVLEEI